MAKSKFWDRKTVKKFIRSIFELLLILAILFAVIRTVYTGNTYEPYADEFASASGDHGFIAVSYFAVDRLGSSSSMSTSRLESHIGALKESGYVTITQQDVLNYYQNGTPLPEKALFLLFEDGRRDSAIYAQRILEKHNYIASMLSYGENLGLKSSMRLLSGKDLRELRDSSFWEMGTNGYRLEYINVFDQDGEYLGELNNEEFTAVSSYIEQYNHYLMDYLYDGELIPLESNTQMKERIAEDYTLMNSVYNDHLDELPGLYAIMHANTGQFGSNDRVSAENEQHIHEWFSMNFNRAGHSLNLYSDNSDIYDMTRIQPEAHWSANHLLTHLAADTGNDDMAWQVGDEGQAAQWEQITGTAEFTTPELWLTSQKDAEGRLRLVGSETHADVHLTATLAGNMLGRQSVMLRAAADDSQYIAVDVRNNNLVIRQCSAGGEEEELFILDLGTIVTDDATEAVNSAQQAAAGYAAQNAAQGITQEILTGEVSEQVTESSRDESTISYNEPGLRQLDIELKGDQLTVLVDGQAAAELEVQVSQPGSLYLCSEWGNTEQLEIERQNLFVDDVYDAVFRDLIIQYDGGGETAFDNTLQGPAQYRQKWMEIQNTITDWFAHMA